MKIVVSNWWISSRKGIASGNYKRYGNAIKEIRKDHSVFIVTGGGKQRVNILELRGPLVLISNM